MLDTLLALLESGQIAGARAELLEAITAILAAGAATGDLRPDVTAEDVADSLIGLLAVAGKSGRREDRAARLLNLLMDGLRPPAV